jgi:uncharacterized membrane protein YheB (UPF0754 family)
MAMGASTIDTEQQLRVLDDEDLRLLEQVTQVLADPGLHDRQRETLHREIHRLLRATHEAVYHAAVQQVHGAAPHELRDSMLEHDPHTTKLLEAVLVDPNLNTDRRMRLYHEIPELFRTAHDHDGAS